MIRGGNFDELKPCCIRRSQPKKRNMLFVFFVCRICVLPLIQSIFFSNAHKSQVCFIKKMKGMKYSYLDYICIFLPVRELLFNCFETSLFLLSARFFLKSFSFFSLSKKRNTLLCKKKKLQQKKNIRESERKR